MHTSLSICLLNKMHKDYVVPVFCTPVDCTPSGGSEYAEEIRKGAEDIGS